MPDAPPQTRPPRISAKDRLKKLLEEYGSVAIGVFAVIWVLTLGGIWLAVKAGWRPESAAGQAGTFGAAYVVFRFTLPLRIAATLALTPLVARILERLRLRRPRPPLR